MKKDYELEKYLLIDTDRCKISNFVKLKISNSKLYIEQGRHRNILLDKRLCPLCKIEIEDEFHFMLKCIKLADCRQRLFNQIATIIPSFSALSEEEKFILIFNFNEYDITKIIINGVNDLLSLRN